VLEIKTAGRCSDEWGEPGTGEIPDHYALQVHQYLLVTGYRWAELAVLFLAERRFAIYHLEADLELQAWLVELERQFWTAHVEQRVPPEPQSLADLAKRYPKDIGSRVIAEPDVIAAVADLRQVKTTLKELTDRQDALEITVKLALGEASELVGADGKPLATWKTQGRKALDTKGIQAAHPELAAQFTKTTESRVFRLK
jgi:predicted phage-related endonuclease